MKKFEMLVILVIVSTLALSLSACQPETVVVTEEVVVTATPEPIVAKTFTQMVTEAMAEVPAVSPEEAQRRMEKDSNVLVIDPRDAADIPYTGIIPGAMNISYGSLTYRADDEVPPEWRELELQDRARPIIMACATGELGALAGKLLQDMGFTNISNLEGGTQAWVDAGFPVDEFSPGA
jgi:rhodanese-related sulfurtransferase